MAEINGRKQKKKCTVFELIIIINNKSALQKKDNTIDY